MKTEAPSIETVKPNPEWASLPIFDRTGWKRLAFREFAESIGERAEPKDAQEEIYVGLEHLDPQCLHIRRWGKGSDVIGGKLRFRKGDIIFGKRRAYQRKLAVAEFSGICSAHALVMRAKPDMILPEFLPFLMMSDRFMNRAVEISVGSLSPTINWTTLKQQTFDLPPLDQQRRIAEILWAVDETLVEFLALRETVKRVSGIHVDQMLSEAGEKFPSEPLRELLSGKPQYGANASAVALRVGMPRYVRITDIDDSGRLLTDSAMGVELDKESTEQYSLVDGDLLIARTGNTVGKSYLYSSSDGPCVYAGYLVRFQPNQRKVLPDYLFTVTKSSYYRNWLENTVRVGAQPNVNGTEYASLKIPAPPLSFQREKLAELERMSAAATNCDDHASAIRTMNTAILNMIFCQ